jgi:hypothetical protein
VLRVHPIDINVVIIHSFGVRDVGRLQVLPMGGVNHCSLHCLSAKFRGLMIRVKYGAVIG